MVAVSLKKIFFKQKTAYEILMGDWSSDVCSSDLEQASYDLSRRHRVRVATSDGMEQMIILGHGAERMSATELKWEVEQADEHLRGILDKMRN